MSSIGERLKEWRELKGLKQPDAASLFGVKPSTYQKYEMDLSAPGAGAMECFVRAGINANWLLTGEGVMFLSDLIPMWESTPGGLDLPRLQLALEAVEEGLAAARRSMPPAKKAELALAVYDLLEEPTNTKERILKLVKLAA